MSAVVDAPAGRAVVAVALLALAATGCGKRGDPLPPLRRAPLPVSALGVTQRGDVLEVRFTAPRAYTDGARLPVVDIELWRADREGALEQVGRRTVRPAAPGETLVESERLPAPGTTLRFAARARVKKNASVLASAAPFVVQAPPPVPSEVKAGSAERGVRLTWQVPPAAAGATPSFRVYRRGADGRYGAPLIAAPTLTPGFEDSTAIQGQRYCYVVRTVTALDPLVESGPSAEACVDVADVTPPGVPESGAAFVQEDGSIEISWSPLLETDLAGYRVYRRLAHGARERVAELPTETRWRDETPSAARRVYTITAFDKAGNESAHSPAIVVERQP